MSGKEIKVEQIDVDTFGEFLASNGVPKEAVPFVKAIQSGIRDDALAIESDDFKTLLGRPLTPIKERIHEMISK